VKVIYTYGESVIGRELLQIRRIINSRAKIVHRYDASEAPGGIFRYEIESGGDIPAHHIPMGKEIAPGRVFLGPVTGYAADLREIVVKGLVAQGYLGEPELTAERFGIDEAGVAYWKSGDLVRLMSNGDLIHEGRIDNLVKINGKVVSTRYVETSILTISGIRHAAVVAEKRLNGRYSLSAHVEIDPLLNMSQDFIKEKLTALGLTTALPRKIFRHEKLPLTNRGKIDYKILRENHWPTWLDTRTVPPSQDLESALQEKIARILSLDEIDADQDLWKAGLDSLGAIELSVIITGMGFLNVQPTDFAEYSTIRSITNYLESIAVGGGATSFTFNPEGTEKPIFALLPAGQSPLIFHGLAELLGAKQPVVAITSIDFSAEQLRLRTIEKIAANHLEKVRSIQPEGPINLVGYCFGAIVAYDMAQQEVRRGGQAKVTMLDSWFPSLHVDGPRPVSQLPFLLARRLQKAPRMMAANAYYRTLAMYYRGTGKIPHNLTGTKYFLPKILSYSWYKIADSYDPQPASFPLAYIEGNEGQLMKEINQLVPTHLRTMRRVEADHAKILDKESLPIIAEVLRATN
jgi:acyl carrier protein